MDGFNDTVAAVATPAGTGGIGVVRISGPRAFELAARVFRPRDPRRSLQRLGGYRAMLGDILDRQGRVLDEAVVLGFRAPRSYTGEDVVELQCHGGAALPGELLGLLVEAGVRPAGPGEFTRRAFMNGRISLDQAEAVMALISSNGSQGAAAASRLMRGEMFRRLQPLKELLVEVMADISAVIEFPEEGLEELDQAAETEKLRQALGELEGLLESYGAGEAVLRGIPTAIVGSPNVGKSTLMNLLSGCRRAIVTPVAGTTRDVVEQQVQLEEMTLLLADTAGLRQSDDPVEQAGIELARQKLQEAALVIAVFDLSRELTAEDIALAESLRGRPAVAVFNKTDLPPALELGRIAPCFESRVMMSALEGGLHLPDLAREIRRQVGISELSPDQPLLANQRQRDCALRASRALGRAIADWEAGVTPDAVHFTVGEALDALMELTGESAGEAVIEDVFSRFCVGK